MAFGFKIARMNEKKSNFVRDSILDSSLISATLPKFLYDTKIIKCGNYTQIYKRKSTIRSSNGWEKNKKEKVLNQILYCNIDEDDLKCNDSKFETNKTLKEIEEKNLIRSKNNMCRLILSNKDIFKTFITLTFDCDMFDISSANKEYHKFISKIKRVFNNFECVTVPEFQKNGRVHYHLLTNINYNNLILFNENIQFNLLLNKFKSNKYGLYKCDLKLNKILFNKDIKHLNDFPICLRYQNSKLHNTKKTWSKKSKCFKIFKTIKYWQHGFTNVSNIDFDNDFNIAGYMSKYMLKDIDNRLFGKHRYFYTQNLIKPQILYLDSENDIDKLILDMEFSKSEIMFSKQYKDKFNNDVEFYEIKSDYGFIDYFKN